jgi:hypothetical protein
MTEIVCSSPHGPVVFRAEDWYAVHGTDLLHRRRWVGTGTDLEVSFMTFPGDDLDTVRRHARDALARSGP